MYLDSDKIKVFPSARRNDGVNDPFSRLMSESTLVSIVNRLIDTDGFVITNEYVANSPLEFNIHGYYFKVANVGNIVSSFSSVATGTLVYAIITLSQISGAALTFLELKNIDDSGKYQGVLFDTSIPTPTGTDEVYSLAVLEKTSSGWKIPYDSLIKFNNDGGLI